MKEQINVAPIENDESARELGCGKLDDDGLYHCHSCGTRFLNGGLKGYANWFCSERCRNWFAESKASHKEQERRTRDIRDWNPEKLENDKKPWRVVAGPPDLPIGTIYYNKVGGIQGTINDLRSADNKKAMKDRTDPELLFEEQIEYNKQKYGYNIQNGKIHMASNKDRLTEVAKALNVSKSNIKEGKLKGKLGTIDHDDREHWKLKVAGRSKRHFSGIKRRLGFMENTIDNDSGGEFQLNRMPTAGEAHYIRRAVGLNRRPELSKEHLQALSQRFKKGKMEGNESRR